MADSASTNSNRAGGKEIPLTETEFSAPSAWAIATEFSVRATEAVAVGTFADTCCPLSTDKGAETAVPALIVAVKRAIKIVLTKNTLRAP